jgi:biopolymer transport protein TolQ
MMLLVQAAGAVPTSAKDLILHSSTATQVVLGILIVLSLVSWAIMIGVGRELTTSLRDATRFAREVERAPRVDEAAVTARLGAPNAAQRTLVRAIQFVGERGAEGSAHSPMAQSMSRVETLRLVLDAESLAERDRHGRFLPWLATIGSASPLIGLLGTVLGVINAFVAIPATFGYNILANRLNRLENLLEGFGTTVIAMLVREGRL